MMVKTVEIGDLIDIDNYGIGAIVDMWHDDEEDVERATVWLIAQQRWIFIHSKEWEVNNADKQ